MRHTDAVPRLRDIPAAIGLLSRLPVRVDAARATQRGAHAAWAYPIAGLVVAFMACLVGEAALRIGLPAPIAAGLLLATMIIITGALHEDGLADCADGLWGGWDTATRLSIMKDSHIGAYGTLALILGLGLRWLAISVIITGDIWPAMLATATLSRASMVPLMANLPHARSGGLSRAVGHPPPLTVLIAVGVAGVATFLLLPAVAIWLIAAATLATLACAAIAKSKIGGQTGDILGATQQISEITLLLILTVLL